MLARVYLLVCAGVDASMDIDGRSEDNHPVADGVCVVYLDQYSMCTYCFCCDRACMGTTVCSWQHNIRYVSYMFGVFTYLIFGVGSAGASIKKPSLGDNVKRFEDGAMLQLSCVFAMSYTG
jgi:hypothetical protein